MPVIIHPSPLSSFFLSCSQEFGIIGWGIALQLHSFGMGDAVVSIFQSYIRVVIVFIYLAIEFCALLILIILEAIRGEHRLIVKIYH